MSEPRFSVIVPAYNSAEYIRKGLDSIRSQTYKNYELIVVCDRCLDRTHNIARDYTDIVFDVDYGRDGLTRNYGIDRAKGEWILFMDDDDWWLHEFAFQMLSGAIDRNELLDIIAFAFIWKHVGYVQNTKDNMLIATWNKCWNRNAVADTRFGDAERESDFVFHNEMMAKNLKIGVWDQPLYYYNFLREGSQTFNTDISIMRPFDANLKRAILREKS